MHMLMWGIRHHNLREVFGETVRVLAAATVAWTGFVPHGNTDIVEPRHLMVGQGNVDRGHVAFELCDPSLRIYPGRH